ncbi:MAG TPA: Trm112 family protein [Armatimonadota bacterium]|nr:Trm112 family protein [Armatimonadota bacterium]HOM71379.1 Trm112 family protein [Armatimonadota bacterium]HOP80050.1 Trm112 family protein [Armatimonadota bacterium]HPP74269.1 Trm112 family protein [Armatimonadota bacterium]
MGEINKKLLDILCCPACDDRPKVELSDNRLICKKCGRAYPVRDGIPVMLVDEAEITEEKE